MFIYLIEIFPDICMLYGRGGIMGKNVVELPTI